MKAALPPLGRLWSVWAAVCAVLLAPFPLWAGPDVVLSVGDRATLHVSGLERHSVADPSILTAEYADSRNIILTARREGETEVVVSKRGTPPARFLVRVGPEGAGAKSRRNIAPAAWAGGAGSATAAVQAPDDRQALTLYVGAVSTHRLGEVARMVVGNDTLVRASTLDDGSLLLLGLAAGVSELDVWTDGGRHHRFQIRVYAAPPSDQMQVVRAVFQEFPQVTVEDRLGTLVLRGTVDARRFEAYERLVRGFPNLVSLATPELNIDVENAIALDVAVLEVNRSYQRNVGIRWQDTAAGPAVGVVGNLIPNRRFGVISEVGDRDVLEGLLGATGSGTQRLAGYLGITSVLGSELQLLHEEGNARILAAPSLSTTSGEAATFLAGGEIPVAILNEFGQPVVEFRRFGIQLEIEPIADRHMNIRSRIRAEVSSVDFSVQVNGVPGLLRRETTSTITARPGETIILSGLLNASDARNADKLPWLGDIPVLGALFRSSGFNQQRTELVVTVTPRIQRPNTPINADLQAAERHLRTVLKGGERLNGQLME